MNAGMREIVWTLTSKVHGETPVAFAAPKSLRSIARLVT